jgi:hypothetical protein
MSHPEFSQKYHRRSTDPAPGDGNGEGLIVLVAWCIVIVPPIALALWAAFG